MENHCSWRSVTIEHMQMVVSESDEVTAMKFILPPFLEKISGWFYHTVAIFDLSAFHRLEYLAPQGLTNVVPTTCQLHRLRFLKFQSINMDRLVAVLQCSPNLEALTITCWTYGQTPDPETTSMVSLPILTEFNVNLQAAAQVDWREWSGLFGHLQCPSLVNFTFLLPSSDNVCLLLKGFFSQSRPPLECFHLEAMSNGPDSEDEHCLSHTTTAFLNILKALPCLIFLNIKGPLAISPEFLDALAKNRPDGHGLCPQLTHTIVAHANVYYQSFKLSDGRETAR